MSNHIENIMKKRNKSMKLIMAMSLLFVFSITESLAQEIPLQPNQTENTYKTWNVNGIVDIQIRDARDRGKALEGSHKIKYRCRKDSEFQFTDVVFEGGAQGAVVPEAVVAAIDFRILKHKTTSLAQRNNFLHRTTHERHTFEIN
mgnify:CR=1 FL=1